jgi:L-seryl-tRNA(Ser) seleniumtransferase
MHPEVAAAMAEASRASVDMVELQAAASARIAAATGAESGLVTSGAAAGLLLAAAACIARLDLAVMAHLPATPRSAGERVANEVLMARSQRNATTTPSGPRGADRRGGAAHRFAGAGERDAEPWEFAAAMGPRSAAVRLGGRRPSRPPLADLALSLASAPCR